MEVREGYKQTEIGVIPEGWNIASYEDVFTFLSTATYSRSQLSNHNKVQYLHYGDIHTKYHFHLDFDKEKLPSITDELAHKYSQLQDGDIVMTDASEDYSGICKSIEVKNIRDREAIAGLHTFLLRDARNTFVNGFKGYLSSSTLLKRQFDQYATGMKVYGVSKTNLKKILIPIPPKPEQQAIAQALSDTDALIGSLEKLIEKKRHIKQGAMQELLTGKRRLPGFEVKQGYKQTEIGEIPVDWKIYTLEHIINKMRLGGNYPNQEEESSFPLIKMGNLGRGKIKLNKLEFISRTTDPIENDKLKRGDILFNTRNTLDLVGKVSIWNNELNEAYYNSNILRISFNDKYVSSNRYMNYIFNTVYMLQELKNIAIGTTSVAAIYGRDLVKIKLYLPDKKEQQAIATVLSDMDSEIEALESKLQKTREIKDGMMHELLTGRIRLIKPKGDRDAS